MLQYGRRCYSLTSLSPSLNRRSPSIFLRSRINKNNVYINNNKTTTSSTTSSSGRSSSSSSRNSICCKKSRVSTTTPVRQYLSVPKRSLHNSKRIIHHENNHNNSTTKNRNKRLMSNTTTTSTNTGGVVDASSSASSSTTSAFTVQEVTLINKLEAIADRPGALDLWVRQLSTSQQLELIQLVSKATAVTTVGGGGENIKNQIPEPSPRDLRLVALTTAIPFVGFGIMDNAILIIAGDAIDTSLGVAFGITTMCAAAIGNIVSDIAGIALGTAIEDFCALYLNLPIPNVTTAQRQLRSVRFANQFGCGVGITIGCIIGMFPLFLIDSNKVQIRKREAHLDGIFKDVITQAGTLVGATRVCLYLRVDDKTNPIPDPDGRYIYMKYDAASAHRKTPTIKDKSHNAFSDNTTKTTTSITKTEIAEEVTKRERYIPVGRGILSRAFLTGEAWNIVDVHSEPDFVPDLGYVDWEDAITNAGRKTKSMICVPIFDSLGRPIAVIQAVNKITKGKADIDNNQHHHHQDPVTSAVAEHADRKNKEQKQKQMENNYNNNMSNNIDNEVYAFTENDVQIFKALASHIGVSLQRMYEQAEGEEAELRLQDTIRLLKDYGLAGITKEEVAQSTSSDYATTTTTTRRPLFPDDEKSTTSS